MYSVAGNFPVIYHAKERGKAKPITNSATGADGHVNSGTSTGQYNNAGFWIGTGSTIGWSNTVWTMTTGTGNLPKVLGLGGQ